MSENAMVFEGEAEFDPAADFETFLAKVPARWVVYLVSDADDAPLQLLCVKNLRASLKRRLGGNEQMGPTRRVNYRDVVRRVRWQRVDSTFEADWVYHEIARQIFPRTYRGMLGHRPAWFVQINPDTRFPRFVKTIELSRPGVYLGPLEDKHAAARLYHSIEDLFDLCRYYNILIEAPNGRACAYKEMGKCPAPCDGSISMAQYHNQIDLALRTLADPADAVRSHNRRMQQAAIELRFETAAKIKQYVDELSKLGKGAFRHVRKLEDFAFLSIQPGPRKGSAKLFLICPGEIQALACTIGEKPRPAEIIRAALTAAAEQSSKPINDVGIERIGIVAGHLFSPKALPGVFMRLDDLSEPKVAKAINDLWKKLAEPVESDDDEGVLKELDSIE
jgi:excinuclease UvrABC nuclease subunit